MTTRHGCLACGYVATWVENETPCPCGGASVELPTAADVLAFKLRMSGRGDEAARVADDMAVLQEHRPSGRRGMSDSPAARLKALPRFHVVVGYSRGTDGPPDVAEAVLLADALAAVRHPPSLRGAARMSRPRVDAEARP